MDIKQIEKEFDEKFIPQDILIEDFGNEIAKRDERIKVFYRKAFKELLEYLSLEEEKCPDNVKWALDKLIKDLD